MKINSLIGLLLIASIFSSCNNQKKLQEYSYFNDKLDSSHRVLTSMEATIKVDDRLSIRVSALNPESAAPYNMSVGTAGATGGSSSGTTGTGYLVEKDGTIIFPELGKLKVEGQTLRELRDELVKKLEKYLTNPVVTVQFANAKVLIMGEVAHPGDIPITDGRLTILEAITLSGDVLPIVGRKDNVLVIREENGERTFNRVDIRSHDIYKSPYYFLKQNDLIYVEANIQKMRQQTLQIFTTNISVFTTVTTLLTTVFLISNYIKK